MQRLTKKIALSRLYSRRQAEQLIKTKAVTVNDILITSPAFLVEDNDIIKIKGKLLKIITQKPKLWLFNKPTRCLTTKNDPKGRLTIYNLLPKHLQQILYVGRLDYNSEGLLLLTNSGDLVNYLTSAKSNITRIYKVKTFGKITQEKLNTLSKGITINGISYGKIKATIIKQNNLQTWISFILTEGKNNEIRKICKHFKLQVSRLVRTSFGKFNLNNLKKGLIKEIPQEKIQTFFPNIFT